MKRLTRVLRNLGNWLMLAGIGIVIGLVFRRSEMKKTKSETQMTDHHILPTSVGGTDHKSNIAKVENRHHEIFHMLFVNKTPDEIITYLVEYFFNGDWEWVEKALARRKQ